MEIMMMCNEIAIVSAMVTGSIPTMGVFIRRTRKTRRVLNNM